MSNSNNSGSIGAWDPQGALPSPQDELRKALPEPIAFPKFPTFQELARQDALMQLAPAQKISRGVFEELLSGRPEPILQSAAESPDRYDEQALSLLRALYNNSARFSDFTPEEKDLINRATMEFFSATPAAKTPPATQPRAVQPPAGSAIIAEPVEGPVVDSFWWT